MRNVPFLSSWLLILTWILGDAFKLAYFIFKQAPTPFVVCGSIQFCTDSLIAIVMCCDSSRRSVQSGII
jgi:solute carrier family 66, member 2